MTNALRFEKVRFAYDRVDVFRSLDLEIAEGEITAVLGPNGTGKTTLLRLAAGGLETGGGRIELFGEELTSIRAKRRARTVAVVPQETHLAFDFTAGEVVLMGRSPHLGLLGMERARDVALAREAMERTDVAALADRPFRALSGGERQGVVLARALAQEPRLLLLDEPTAFLDLRHQLAAYGFLTRLNRERGLTVVVASHDLNLAARHCRRLVLLSGGEVAADGTPEEVLRPENLRAVYGIDAHVRHDPDTGRPFVVPG